MNKKNSLVKQLLAGPYLLWMIGFTVIPLCLIAYQGLTDKNGHFTWDNILAITDMKYMEALSLSLLLALISTIICLLVAYPIALILRSKGTDKKSFIVFIFILPMWMNFLLRTMAWQTLLEKNGVINALLGAVGLPPINIINTTGAIVLGMVYNYLPFMVLPLYNVLIKIDENIINAARDLGANAVQTFVRIILPLSLPGIISGITMVFVPALTTFIISDILGGSKILLIGNVIEQKFNYLNDWHAGSGLSLILMVFILLCMILINKYDKNGEGTSF